MVTVINVGITGGGLLRVYSCSYVLQIGVDSKRLQVHENLYRAPIHLLPNRVRPAQSGACSLVPTHYKVLLLEQEE
jgi:hypothetical protein